MRIPEEERGAFLPRDLRPELLKMTDRYCDELFGCGRPMLVFGVSRLVCDVERFPRDDDEPMARKGMGFAYTRLSDGAPLRELTPEQKDRIFREYYVPHHRALSAMVAERLRERGECRIVDAHSFSPVPLPHEDAQDPDRPDFCIGTDPFHTPEALWETARDTLAGAGCTVKRNTPFSGAIVPLESFGRDARVRSVMIEVNRRLYMRPDGEKSEDFAAVRALLGRLLDALAR